MATLQFRAAATHPQSFRDRLLLNPADSSLFQSVALPWQKRDLKILDPAWLHLAGLGTRPAIQRAYIERPRGHSKTTDTAVQLAWILQYSTHPLNGICTAADLEQALLIRQALVNLVNCNKVLLPDLIIQKHLVFNPRNQTQLNFISSDVPSSWGLLPDFVICDEIAHWTKADLWFSLLSSAAKKPNSILLLLSNAGVGTDWQWELRESARQSPAWHFSTLDGPQAPWITQHWLNEQKQLLPEPVFNRLWNNQWQHSDGTFLTLAEAQSCRDEILSETQFAQPNTHYYAAIDYAEKHDYTVATLVHLENSKIIIDRMDVVVPSPQQPTPVAWVANWIDNTAKNFPTLTIVVDPYQLVSIIQHYETQLDIRRFEFLSGKANHKLALTLRQLILERRLSWYPGCGQLQHTRDTDTLETELASVLLRQSSSGLLRIDHTRSQHNHDDRVFALGAACLTALDEHSASAFPMTVTPPDRDNSFAW